MKAVTAVLLLAASLTPLSAADSADAASASVQLSYTCDFPAIGSRPMTATVQWDTPASVPVNTSTPALPISVTGIVPQDVTLDLHLIGAVSLQGSAEADVAVQAPPNATVPETVPLVISRTGLPVAGPLTVPAHGTTPALSFAQPGHAQVTVGAVTMHLDTYSVLGTLVRSFDVPCRLNSGQNDVLASFDITAASPTGSTPPPPTTPTSVANTGTPPVARTTASSAGTGTSSQAHATPPSASGPTTAPSDSTSPSDTQSSAPGTSSAAGSSTGAASTPSTSAAADDAPLAKSAGSDDGTAGASVGVLLAFAVGFAVVGTAIVVGMRRLKRRQGR